MILVESVETKFKELFNEQPFLIRSPGRVNLIGEHTDYNDGYVLPAAIDKAIYLAVKPRTDKCCKVFALDLKEERDFGIRDPKPTEKTWPNYLMGVVDQLVKGGHRLNGFNCVFAGDIPIGAGLSSSAAIETGLAYALNHIFDLGIANLELVKLAQRAENEFVGVQCGIMDQYVNIFGEQDRALCIDCRSLDYEYYPFDHDVSIVLFDTRVPHSLASSEYNQRRKECAEGVEIISRSYPSVTHLRDVSAEMLAEFQSELGEKIYRRCKYVVEENERVLEACSALKKKDMEAFGQHMYETHEGLSHGYEVSCDELDFLVELVKDDPKVYGARMMGGGFGGCTINLVQKDETERIMNMVTENYSHRFALEPRTYVTTISAGTSIIFANGQTSSVRDKKSQVHS
jgi:galactokinase